MSKDFNPLADLPMGFGMALMQNENAMRRFASMSDDEQKSVLSQTHAIQSKKEMQAFVNHLGDSGAVL